MATTFQEQTDPRLFGLPEGSDGFKESMEEAFREEYPEDYRPAEWETPTLDASAPGQPWTPPEPLVPEPTAPQPGYEPQTPTQTPDERERLLIERERLLAEKERLQQQAWQHIQAQAQQIQQQAQEPKSEFDRVIEAKVQEKVAPFIQNASQQQEQAQKAQAIGMMMSTYANNPNTPEFDKYATAAAQAMGPAAAQQMLRDAGPIEAGRRMYIMGRGILGSSAPEPQQYQAAPAPQQYAPPVSPRPQVDQPRMMNENPYRAMPRGPMVTGGAPQASSTSWSDLDARIANMSYDELAQFSEKHPTEYKRLLTFGTTDPRAVPTR